MSTNAHKEIRSSRIHTVSSGALVVPLHSSELFASLHPWQVFSWVPEVGNELSPRAEMADAILHALIQLSEVDFSKRGISTSYVG